MNKKYIIIDKKINFSVILTLSVFFIILIVELVLIGNSNVVSNLIISERIDNDLTTFAKLNARHAEILLQEQKEKLRTLADTELIESELESIFKGDVTQEGLDILSNELSEIYENDDDDFEEVYILDLDGTIVSSSNPNSVGKTVPVAIGFLNSEEKTRLSGVYNSDILKKNVIDISSKVFTDENQKIGALVGVLTLKELSEIVTAEGLGVTGESYVVDNKGFFITPSNFFKGENKGLLAQKIDTQNSRECFQSIQEISEHPVYSNYLNYRGASVLGTHAPIPGTEWCVITTIDSDEVDENSRKVFFKSLIAIPLIVLLIITFFAFSLGRFLDKKYKEVK